MGLATLFKSCFGKTKKSKQPAASTKVGPTTTVSDSVPLTTHITPAVYEPKPVEKPNAVTPAAKPAPKPTPKPTPKITNYSSPSYNGGSGGGGGGGHTSTSTSGFIARAMLVEEGIAAAMVVEVAEAEETEEVEEVEETEEAEEEAEEEEIKPSEGEPGDNFHSSRIAESVRLRQCNYNSH
jgi:uncharacterized membrane protein